MKLKIGADLDREVEALRTIRAAHPALPLRVDGNRRVDLGGLRRVAAALEALELELVEEPVNPAEWLDASTLPLPFALDETLVDRSRAWQLLDTGRIRAVVLKPMLLGGFQACFEIAERAAQCGADFLVSHSFDGPIARAATAELALALRTPLAAGLGPHPGLSLWPPHRIAAVEGREIRPHASPGLGLQLEETDE